MNFSSWIGKCVLKMCIFILHILVTLILCPHKAVFYGYLYKNSKTAAFTLPHIPIGMRTFHENSVFVLSFLNENTFKVFFK